MRAAIALASDRSSLGALDMPEIQLPREAEIIHVLPDDLATEIGRVVVAYARLEHKLTMLTGLLLQLNRPEGRIVLRTPRAVDRLDMALDLFAIKDIPLAANTEELRGLIQSASTGRDLVAHSIWLKDDPSGKIYVFSTRGSWPKDLTRGERVNRAIFPQSIPYSPEDCKAVLALIEKAMAGVDALGAELDDAIQASPEKFRPPSPLLNPLGRRTPKGNEPPPEPFEA